MLIIAILTHVKFLGCINYLKFKKTGVISTLQVKSHTSCTELPKGVIRDGEENGQVLHTPEKHAHLSTLYW